MKKRNFVGICEGLMLFAALFGRAGCAGAENQSNIRPGYFDTEYAGQTDARERDSLCVTRTDRTFLFRNAPASISHVTQAPDGSVLVLYTTEETEKWQWRLSLFTASGEEQWRYMAAEYDADSGWNSAVDLYTRDDEIVLNVYENREQTAYEEVRLKWDGAVSRKRAVKIIDDMRRRVHDFPLYTVKEFYTNARAEIVSKRNGCALTIDMPYGSSYFAQLGQGWLICAMVEGENAVFQMMDEQGKLHLAEGKADAELDFKCFVGIRNQKAYALFTDGTEAPRWLMGSVDFAENTVDFEDVPLARDSGWYDTAATAIQEGFLFAQYDAEQRQVRFTLLREDGTTANCLNDVPDGYYRFMNNGDEGCIQSVRWNGSDGCMHIATYTPTVLNPHAAYHDTESRGLSE